ncbi:zinc finger BED domain-containing protein 5 [Biomphalaria glabrata]|nr:zinc finger BED domain-containing protein 5 [Biomphalaria glabrata]
MCLESVVCRTSSVKRHYESNHSWLLGKSEDEQKEHLSRELKKAISQSSSFVNFVKSSSNLVAASFEVSKIIAKHGKLLSDGDYIKEAMLELASYLFEDFQNKDKVIQRIKDLPISRNTVKARVMKLHVNIQEQVKKDINACQAYSICLDESNDVTSSARLAIIAKYSKGKEIHEELTLL